jgi:hypothetical protein
MIIKLSNTVPTSNRPSAIDPPENHGAVPRITINALAQAKIVTAIAMITRALSDEAVTEGFGR